MILTHPSEVRALLDRLGVKPNRMLGQNFLIDANVLRILLETAQLYPRDGVLEVGAGLGVLTEWLARRVETVVAVEKDARLAAYLRERLANMPNVRLIEADVMDLPLNELLARPINKMVANLPYSIASRLLFAVSESPRAPETITVTVQKEVADRIVATPGGRDYGLLSVALQMKYTAMKVRDISRTCFLPPPDVASSLVHMERREEPLEPSDAGFFKQLLKSAFAGRRKQMLGWLERNYELGRPEAENLLQEAGIPPQSRPEMISPEQWVRLADSVSQRLNARKRRPSDPPTS